MVEGNVTTFGRMNAVVCYAPQDYHLEELEIPEMGRDEVLVKVGACRICA